MRTIAPRSASVIGCCHPLLRTSESIVVGSMHTYTDGIGYHNATDGSAATQTLPMMKGMNALIGRPRYRQLRTKANSCSHPSIVPAATDTCFAGAPGFSNMWFLQGMPYSYSDDTKWDKQPIACGQADDASSSLARTVSGAVTVNTTTA